jgi:hypothetical protein
MRNTRRIGWIVIGAAVMVTLTVSGARAGARDHYDGFFLRMSAGGGAAATEATFQGIKEKYSGGVGEFNFAVGAMVSPQLALHGTVWGWVLSDPDHEVNGVTYHPNAELTMAAAGGGVTYYFMPSNVYLSGSIGIGKLSLDAGSITVDTDAGVVFDFTAGKEWWVGNHWGLGAALGVSAHSIPDGFVDANWSGPSLALRFSATYN